MRTRLRHPITGWLLLASLLFWVPAAQAERVAPDCSADPACLNLYERAKTASNAGDLDEALRLYKLAYDVRADPLLLFSIARILHKQGKTQEAVPYYTRFLAAPSDDPVPRKKAEEYLAQIREPSSTPDPAPEQPSPKPDPPPAAESTPIYKKWSFKKFLNSDGGGCWNEGGPVRSTYRKKPPPLLPELSLAVVCAQLLARRSSSSTC